MNRKKRLLQIPQGTEGLYLEEALRHKMIVRKIEDLFLTWGYLPVETPVFDFFDTYKAYLPQDQLDKIYRLMDREGDLLMLRSDVTLFLCKQLGMSLNLKDLPVRAFYGDTILRHQNAEDISRNEFFQLGAELIGPVGNEGDLEILVLVAELLETLGLSWKLHIGLGSITGRLKRSLTLQQYTELHDAVLLRDFSIVKTLMTECGTPFDPDLFAFIGSVSEFASWLDRASTRSTSYPDDILHECKGLLSLLSNLSQFVDTTHIRIDMSELGSQAYHTGMVFQGYTPGIDSAFLSGGRYDRLLHDFGFDAPAAGFSILLRKIADLIKIPHRPPAEKAVGSSFGERLQKARILRSKGKAVHL